MIDFFSRLDKFMEYKELNDNKISVFCGISNGLIGKARKKGGALSLDNISKILYAYPELNSDWLITGRGTMICSNNDNCEQGMISEVSQSYGERKYDKQQVPLYNLCAAASILQLYQDPSTVIDDYISIPNLPKCDGAVYVKGDSMYPLIKAGDIILYKQVNEAITSIIWGEMYLVVFDMEGDYFTVIKYIQPGSDNNHILLLSYNQNHSPKEVHISQIKALALVRASIRYNTL
ncbi:MAG: S24 family peptidase [Bacteroidales bacterium]